MRAAAVLVVAALVTFAAAGAEPVSRADALGELRTANEARTQLGDLVQSRSRSADIAAFGAQLKRDHAELDRAMLEYARAAGVPTRAIDPHAGAPSQRLRTLEGTALDLAFLLELTQSNTAEIAYVQQLGKQFTDPELRRLLNKVLATYRQHQREVDRLYTGLLPAA